MDKFMHLLVFGAGIMCIWASITEQEWFFNSGKARGIVKLFGLEGAKIFYIVIGVICIMGGIAGLFGFF